MDRNFAVPASTTSSQPLPQLYVERASSPPREQVESKFVLSAVARALAIQLALAQPSLADSDSHIRMVLASDPADPLSLAPKVEMVDEPKIETIDELSAAIDMLIAEVPDDEWGKMPANLAATIDEALYKRGT